MLQNCGESSSFQFSTFAAINRKSSSPDEARFRISLTSFSSTASSCSPVSWIKTTSGSGFPYSYVVIIRCCPFSISHHARQICQKKKHAYIFYQYTIFFAIEKQISFLTPISFSIKIKKINQIKKTRIRQ